MAYPLQQHEGLRGAIKAIPPVFWFGAASLLLHLGLLLLWTRPSINFQVTEGNLPVHVEIMGQADSMNRSQPASSSQNRQTLAEAAAPEKPQQTAQLEKSAEPIPKPVTPVQHKPAVQKPESKPDKALAVEKSRVPEVSTPSPKQASAVLASSKPETESPEVSKPKVQSDTNNSSIETTTQPELEQGVKTDVAMASAEAPAEVARRNDTDMQAEAARRLKLYIRKALEAHFRYPLLARKRGWQGEVLLSFDVDSDGRISHVQVSRSSGYRALDQAALKALDKVGRVEQAPLVRVSLELPVTYKLKS
jgi:periplasmic protein TonB